MRSDFATIKFAPHPRTELRKHLIARAAGSKMPDAAVDEIVDMACHAAESGRRAMLETIDRSSDSRIAMTAIGIAGSLLAHDLELLKEGLQFAATQTGLHFEVGTLEVKAHG